MLKIVSQLNWTPASTFSKSWKSASYLLKGRQLSNFQNFGSCYLNYLEIRFLNVLDADFRRAEDSVVVFSRRPEGEWKSASDKFSPTLCKGDTFYYKSKLPDCIQPHRPRLGELFPLSGRFLCTRHIWSVIIIKVHLTWHPRFEKGTVQPLAIFGTTPTSVPTVNHLTLPE